jgi:hypothetical protein
MVSPLLAPGPGYPAAFSEDRGYRYVLWRTLSVERPPIQFKPKVVNFVCLNPSTADERKDDPSLGKMQGFGRRLGYDFLSVTNVFGYRATKPADMRRARDPIGPENDTWLLKVAQNADMVICAWGNHGTYMYRNLAVLEMFRDHGISLYTFGFTNSGQPLHPLMLPYSSQLLPWNGR